MGSERRADDDCDLLVVGGGINGAGIARDAAGRGLKVVLCEKNDLASGTSSVSSKLIHGGLRYLEHYEFRLVREALAERETLLRIMPHIAWPLRFVLPHAADLRPAWMIRIGLFLYDHLAARARLDSSHQISLKDRFEGKPLKDEYDKGFIYSDCWVDDARLVVLNAMDAAARGATILTRTALTHAERSDGRWIATLTDDKGETRTLRARALVNAAGPWVGAVQGGVLGQTGGEHLRLVQGSHIVVPRLHDGAHAYILQNPDKRIVFVIPYEGAFSLIGTTDVPYEGDPAQVRISKDETAYLCASVSRYFAREVTPKDVVWSYSGVRPLYDDAADDPSSVTRDYVLDVTGGDDEAPLLTVYGGKLTTYRKLAEHALEKLQPLLLSYEPDWTGTAPLPGGDMPDANFDTFLARFLSEYPFLPPSLGLRYAHAYGTRANLILGGATSLEGLGQHLGAGLYEREAEYLVAHEWARTADDILLRRSKLALHGGADLRKAVQGWLKSRFGFTAA